MVPYSPVLLGLLLLLGSQTPAFAEEATAAAELEALAKEFRFFRTWDFLYNRTAVRDLPPKEAERYNRLVARLRAVDASVDELVGLLGHKEAKVRTLAIAVLFAKEDPSVLPHIADIANDSAQTFAMPVRISRAMDVGMKIEMPPMKDQTVGDVAACVLRFYLERAGCYYAAHKYKDKTLFGKYWQKRKDRAYCASWFAVRLARASRGSSPTRGEYVADLQRLRKEIDKVQGDDRTWILLWLRGETGSDKLVTEKELVKMCKELGPEKLLLMLQRKIPSEDPDLQPRNYTNWPYRRMMLFVLRHAGQLLRPGDVDKLLECEMWERDYRKHGLRNPLLTPWWVIAVARLQPERAEEILRTAFARFQGKFESEKRSKLAVALFQLVGESQTSFLVDWFYGEEPGMNSRTAFIRNITYSDKPSARKMLACLITDERFTSIDWQSLENIVVTVNGWLDDPIVSQRDIEHANHPLGQQHFDQDPQKAARMFPEETRTLLARLAQWRKKLRESLKEQRWTFPRDGE